MSLSIFCPNATLEEPWKVGVTGWSNSKSEPTFPLDLRPRSHCIHPLWGKNLKANFGYVQGFVMKTERDDVDGFEANTLRLLT